jgi:hypothetical protein
LINAKVEETSTVRPLQLGQQERGDVNDHIAGKYVLSPRYYLDLVGAVGPVAPPPDPPAVLAPGAAGVLGPVEAPADPPVLLLPNPGELLPADPGTPCGAPTAPPLGVPVVCAPAPERLPAMTMAATTVAAINRMTYPLPAVARTDHQRCKPYQSSMSLRT